MYTFSYTESNYWGGGSFWIWANTVLMDSAPPLLLFLSLSFLNGLYLSISEFQSQLLFIMSLFFICLFLYHTPGDPGHPFYYSSKLTQFPSWDMCNCVISITDILPSSITLPFLGAFPSLGQLPHLPDYPSAACLFSA